MMLSLTDWHKRFKQQAEWTQHVRAYLLEKAKFNDKSILLEVGCGTGAILEEISSQNLFGLDNDFSRLQFAKKMNHQLMCGDGHTLPIPSNQFDIVFCHYLFLWLAAPQAALKEMIRTVKPGGWILLIAEPDYSNRIDYPSKLEKLGRLQTESLSNQGADPFMGGKLNELFHSANLTDIEIGELQDTKQQTISKQNWELEWQVLQSDIGHLIPESELSILKELDWQAWQNGERMQFVPTYYACGRKPT